MCELTDGIGVFAEMTSHNGIIMHVSVQAAVCNLTLADLYLDEKVEARYHRCDLDLNQPGPLFAEPVPHIHSGREDTPRFLATHGSSGNLIPDFLDFLYRSYDYETWLDWARSVWEANTTFEPQDDPFGAIVAAYNEGHIVSLIEKFKADLAKLKRLLQEEKDKRYPCRIDTALCREMNYSL